MLGATAELIERGGFAFGGTLAESPEEEANPWLILDRELPGDAIPVFGDANSIQWILHLGLGRNSIGPTPAAAHASSSSPG